jgi:hypothetical protein
MHWRDIFINLKHTLDETLTNQLKQIVYHLTLNPCLITSALPLQPIYTQTVEVFTKRAEQWQQHPSDRWPGWLGQHPR